MSPVIKDKLEDIRTLCIRHNVLWLDIFGSAAIDKLHPNDLDFLVEFQSPLPPGDHANSFFGLLAGLENLFSCSIDLVEDSAIKNPYFREGVNETRKPIYEAA